MRRAVVATDLRDEADIVNAGNRAIAIVLAAGESNLELARQVVKIGMTQEVSRNAQGVRRDVKRFGGANTGHRAGRDVAHRVTASLARGEVAAPGRVFVANKRQDAELCGREHPRGNLDAQHLEARLPLAICAVLQAKGAELFRRAGPALQLLNALFKTDDLRFDGFAAVPFLDFG